MKIELFVSDGTPSVFVPILYDVDDNSTVLKPHTTWQGAESEAKANLNYLTAGYVIAEMELIIDVADLPGSRILHPGRRSHHGVGALRAESGEKCRAK